MRKDVEYTRNRVTWIFGLVITVILGLAPSVAILAYQVTVELPELKRQVQVNQRTLWRKIEGETDRLVGTESQITEEELRDVPPAPKDIK